MRTLLVRNGCYRPLIVLWIPTYVGMTALRGKSARTSPETPNDIIGGILTEPEGREDGAADIIEGHIHSVIPVKTGIQIRSSCATVATVH